MKKSLLILMALVTIGMGGVFMVEDYTEDKVGIQESGNHRLASVTFELPQIGIMFAAAGALTWGGSSSRFWLTLNEDSLGMSTQPDPPNFMRNLEAGAYALDFLVNAHMFDTIVNPRLQVLVLYNEIPSVSENPPGVTPTENRSVLSSGAAVIVPGCTEVIDLSGRVVSSNPPQGRIELSNLSAGTYLARTQNGRTIKIVKL